MRKRFLGTHFFNPPRYLKLLELIPLEETDADMLKQLQWFGRLHLGKGMVVAKDTPGFIANRVGIFVTLLTLHTWLDQGYTIEEVDLLTGSLVGDSGVSVGLGELDPLGVAGPYTVDPEIAWAIV